MGIEEITVSLLACRKTTCREGTHTKTMKFLKDDKHCPYLFDRRYGLYSQFITHFRRYLLLLVPSKALSLRTGMRESDSTDVKYCRLIWIGQNDCDYESEKDYLVGTSPVGIQTNTNYQLENAGVGNFLTKLSYECRFFESKV